MKQYKTIAVIALPLLFASCATKPCGPNDYSGLYNAMTCDYSARITGLKQTLSEEKAKELKLFNAYQKLIANVTHQENRVQAYRESVTHIEQSMSSIEQDINKIKTQKYTQSDITKLKNNLITIRKNIIVKQIRFTDEEVKLAENYLKEQPSDIELTKSFLDPQDTENVKLARGFLEDNENKNIHLVKGYEKSYEENENIKLGLATQLDELISNVMNNEKRGTIDPKTTDMLLASLDETQRYTDSVK